MVNTIKTKQQLMDYIWKKYPNDNQLSTRIAILDAYDFLLGKKDFDEKRRKEISEQIMKKLNNK